MTIPQELDSETGILRRCYRTEFRSQEPEWAKRPAIANRMNFVRLADSVVVASYRASE